MIERFIKSRFPNRFFLLDEVLTAIEETVGFENPYTELVKELSLDFRDNLMFFGPDNCNSNFLLADAELTALRTRPEMAVNPNFPTEELDYFIKSRYRQNVRDDTPNPDEIAMLRSRLAKW